MEEGRASQRAGAARSMSMRHARIHYYNLVGSSLFGGAYIIFEPVLHLKCNAVKLVSAITLKAEKVLTILLLYHNYYTVKSYIFVFYIKF